MSKGREPLEEYYSILAGKRKPGFIRCAGVMLDVDLNSPEETLWREHETGMRILRSGIKSHGAVSLLELKAGLALRLLSPCRLCERRCKVDRLAGETGYCRVGESRISNRFVHLGEEPDLVPSYTIFFSGCTFECLFCQNWDISQTVAGATVSPVTVARDIDLRLGSVRNINWVGGEPTPNLPFVLKVLLHSKSPIPQIWNSNMYMTDEAVRLLDGVIDVYLADFKWGPGGCSRRLSRIHDYWDIVRKNHVLANLHAEIVMRHLLMPGHIDCCTRPVLEWVAGNLDTSKLLVNIMDQYRPEYKAFDIKEINKRITDEEYVRALGIAERLGLRIT